MVNLTPGTDTLKPRGTAEKLRAKWQYVLTKSSLNIAINLKKDDPWGTP